MKVYKETITLNRNNRGCYVIDTVKGCSGLNLYAGGCYHDCYANKIASRYGFCFSNPITRNFIKDNRQLSLFGFDDIRHEYKIIKAIEHIEMPFVRIGEMGDPSENWEHTINVCKSISQAHKPIVIITKHWKEIPDDLLSEIGKLDLYINTSISALDNDSEIVYRLSQHHKVRDYCYAILRVVSCDFNTTNSEGNKRNKTQNYLFGEHRAIIDTVFRPNCQNNLIANGIINVQKIVFLKSTVLASVHNKNAYTGYCDTCPDMCGVT